MSQTRRYGFLILAVLVPLSEDAAQELEVVVQRGHSKTIQCISFSPDGNFVVTGSADHTARIWDTRTGKEIRTFKHHLDEVPSAVYAPDGHTILSVDHGLTYNQVFLWEGETGKIVRRYRVTGALADFYSKQGRVSPDAMSILLCSQTQGARLYDQDFTVW
jgi:WD40 repeat protein